MRSVTIILSLFILEGTSKIYGKTHHFIADTVKHSVRKKISPSIVQLAEKHKDYFDDCVFLNRYSIKQRLKHYPFSTAVKIIAVSYPVEYPTMIPFDGPDQPNDSAVKRKIDTTFTVGLHVKNGKLNNSSIKEIRVLNKAQINKLTNIIYNTDYKVNEFNSYLEGECFDPRNALIFIDKYGKIFDYIEICFECRNSESKSGKITIGTICNQKYDLLKKYFLSLGIKYGTIGH